MRVSFKEGSDNMWFSYAVMWISVAFASCFGVYFTKSAWCLLVLILPAFVRMMQSDGEESNDNTDKKYGEGEE